MRSMRVLGPDLHIHSTASDGTVAPADIVARATKMGLPAISLTDHDSVAGVSAALEAGTRLGITVIPAVELSAGVDGRSMHVLGYFIDHTDLVLTERLERLRAVRLDRAERMVRALAAAGYGIAIADVLLEADGGAVGRAHVARTLVARGYADSMPDAFDRFLGHGRPFYVPKPVAAPAEVMRWISEAGGIAVLAHPAVSEVDDLIEGLAAEGLAGIEAYHRDHDQAERERYTALAARLGLIATGGSDFHGDDRPSGGLGSARVPPAVLDQLLALRPDSARPARP